MIHIQVQKHVQPNLSPDNVLYYLDARLANEKFYGTILLTYEAGTLKGIKAQQNFTVDALIDHLSK